MPFVRTKWIKSGYLGNNKLPYKYLVENYWDKTEKKVKQRTLKYLGPGYMKTPKTMTLEEAEKWIEENNPDTVYEVEFMGKKHTSVYKYRTTEEGRRKQIELSKKKGYWKD